MSSIDIHSGKLVEWVVSRFKLNKDWSEKVTSIREKISNALLDMPESDEIKDLLTGTYINYFHCLKIIDVLKETELSTKNIFGQYSSKRMKDWQEIIKLYDQNNIYLVDCGKILNQLVCFDIPAIKKTIEKNTRTINDSTRKEKDYLSTVNEANSNLKNLFQKYAPEAPMSDVVNNEVIRVQLKKSIADLNPMICEIERHFHILRQPMDLYLRFVRESIGADYKCMVMLSHILEKGNTTVYEWKYDKKPTVVSPNIVEDVPDVASENEEISWDCNGVEDDFSMIDFGIEMKGDVIEETPANEILTLLENHDTREMVLDDLHELEAFFTSCIDEMRLQVGSILDSIENIEEKWPELDIGSVESMRNEICTIIDQLTGKPLMHLLMLKTNPSYMDSILRQVEHERSTLLKFQNLGNLLKNRVTEAALENVTLDKQLKTLKEQCAILKVQIESCISKAFGDRKVRVVGEIATV